MVYDPVADEVFHAERGAGAWLGDERLPIKLHVPHIRNAMANVDFKRLRKQPGRASWLPLRRIPRSATTVPARSSGAIWRPGRLDLYLHGGQKLWDYAAGALILEEAGGGMCTLTQDDFWTDDLWQRSVIAARDPALFQIWKNWIRAHQ